MLGRKRFLKSNFAYFKSILFVLIIKKKRERNKAITLNMVLPHNLTIYRKKTMTNCFINLHKK